MIKQHSNVYHSYPCPTFLVPRVYTERFGVSLLEALAWHRPQATLRQKVRVDSKKTDQEIFVSLDLGDIWPDADLFQVYAYLRRGSKQVVPNSWETTMMNLDGELGNLGLHV